MKPPLKPGHEIAREILQRRQQPLDAFFSPATVAVIGATEAAGSVGRTLLENLIQNPFGGTVYPVNPKRHSVLGVKAYPRISDIPEKIDLAVIVTPASTVPGVVEECAQAQVKAAIIISAGFKEAGPEGVALEKKILEQVRRSRMRVIGPNCLGVMRPTTGLNATFAGGIALPGSVAFISQSGALCTAILDWSRREQVGFSAFMSIGSMLDVGWGDLIDYLGDDPHTTSILIYMESIGDARAFLSAARAVALSKPIIVIKAGRTESAARAAASHTGTLAGSDAVLDAAFRRSGVLRVQRIADLFYMADVLAKQPRPAGPRLLMLTNAGGPGVLATDALIAEGGELAKLSGESQSALDRLLPPHWSHGNPVDILGDASPERYAKAVEVAAKDTGSDGLLVILTPQAMTDPTRTAESLSPFAKIPGKPMLASWMGGTDVEAGREQLTRAGIPAFPYPDTAVRVFSYMWRYTRNLKSLYETPVLPPSSRDGLDQNRAAGLLQKVRAEGRTLLSEPEAKAVLEAYGIPTVRTEIAGTEAKAVACATKIGYPVVLKLYSKTVTHKTDVGGVHLRLLNAQAVRKAFRAIESAVKKQVGPNSFQGVTVQPMIRWEGYELIIGSSLDAQFGPVLLFGSGGQLVEVYQDHSLALPPLTTTLARRLMERTRIYRALKGVRGRKPIDLKALENLLVRFSQLVVEQPWIKEIDINPLLASPEGFCVLDARMVLHDPSIPESSLPRSAIRPYPLQYVSHEKMADGTRVTFRPIRPEDEPLVVKFHETLSERSVYRRYLQTISLDRRIAHERLIRVCFSDYSRDLALVAERKNPKTGEAEIMAIARLAKTPGLPEAEISVLVNDAFQRRGLGMKLVQKLLVIARAEGIRHIHADILAENIGMQRICQKLRFKIRHQPQDSLLEADLELGS